MTDTAILHDEITSVGGAERVAIELARTFDCPLYALQVDKAVVPDDVDGRQLLETDPAARLQNSRLVPGLVGWLAKHLHRMERASYLKPIHEYETVIESKPGVGWYIQSDGQTVVRYVHHGFRRHYSQFDRMGAALKNRFWSLAFRTVSRQTVDYPELLVCNSDLTAQRLRDQHAVSEDRLRVCYPPVETGRFGPQQATTADFYLHLGRLADNKCLPEIIQAYQGRDEQLVIAGDGSKRHIVEDMAAGYANISVLGYVSESRKRELLSAAKAFVMHAHGEDFGIAPVEALASGTPVLGVDEPFTSHQVLDGKNGLLFERGNLSSAVTRFEREGVSWRPERIATAASAFSVDRFRDQIRAHVRDARERREITPRWRDLAPVVDTPEPDAAPVATDGGGADGD